MSGVRNQGLDERRKTREENPCLIEQRFLEDCLFEKKEAKGRMAVCKDEQSNYKNCRHFWKYVEFERLKKSLYPTLPALKDREAAVREHEEAWKQRKESEKEFFNLG